ncbi:coiled-coil and C2 domain-containing protein 2A [Anthonomus grandis grandis]|uniref:coiled-coil and C2 domain-containing protein 2A n=1 Tax=Anthonomus grandis grandis TaxID=2921223 RepID=UPI00216642DF|nr:coiled-coil and C2 domain-containing protein 2A [Anthonomus grandis grandis]
MNSSKEDLLEMTSPTRKLPRLKLRNRNQVHSPPHASPSSGSVRSDQELTSVFSIKSRTAIKTGWSDDTEDTSEISEDIVSESSNGGRRSLLGGKNKFVKTTEKINKLKKSLDILRRESTLVDERVKSLREKLKTQEAQAENKEFSFVNFETHREESIESNSLELIKTYLPQNLQLEVKLCENDHMNFQKYTTLQLDHLLPNPVKLSSIKPKHHTFPGQCSTHVQPHPPYSNLTEILVINQNILELSLLKVKFLHHPLFSLEHVLVRKLTELCDKYRENDNKYSVRDVLEEVKGLKGLGDADSSDQSEVTWKDVRKRRERLIREAREQRERCRNVLSIWKAIKKLRSHQGFSNTNVRLIIKKQLVDLSVEKEQYDVLFKELMGQIIEQQRVSLNKKLSRDSDSEKPTLTIDTTKIESDLKKKLERSLKPPGEPTLHFQLKRDHPITTDPNNASERDRRNVVTSTKFTAKIVCHDLTVCKVKPALLDDDFNLDLNETISIQLLNVPKCLFVELYEHPKGLLKKKIAELKIEIPYPETVYEQSEMLEQTFQRRDIVHYKHSGVGSAESLQKITDFEFTELNMELFEELTTTVVLSYRIGWRSSSARKISVDLPQREHIRRVMDKYGKLDQRVIRNIIKDKNAHLNLDPFVDWLENNLNKDYFRIQPKPFCKISDIETNLRFQYLKLRDQREIEFDGVLVPNRVRQIDFGLIKDFKMRKAREGTFEDLREDVDPETLRENGQRRLKQIQTKIFQKCKGMSDNLSYESVVDEKLLIYFEDLIKISVKNFLNWFRWRPKISNPLPTISANSKPSQVPRSNKIQIQILAGKNVPQRKPVNEDRDELDLVQPFLEICFEHSVYKSGVAFGRDPVWNETIEIPLGWDQMDYLNSNSMCGCICVDLFDELHPNEKFYLGAVRIPLSALGTESNLHGWFKVKRPIALLGYDPETEYDPLKSPAKNWQRSMDEIYLEMDISLCYSVPLLIPNMAELPSNDPPYIKEHILKWNDLFNSSFITKKFQALAIDSSGRTNCITKFLRPLEPPSFTNDDFGNLDVTPERCLRYVSLIPFSKNSQFLQNIWLKTDEMLSLMVGSVVDHCVALVCFLLALNIDAYLVLGFGLPNGPSSYVLYADFPTYIILDVVTNQKFDILDPFCPLQRIYCLANGENVWGNAQRSPTIALLRFDLNRKSNWWPLFNNTITAPSNYLNQKISFSLGKFEEIEAVLERNIKRKFQKWRPTERTNFNPGVSEGIKHTLRYLEMYSLHVKKIGDIMLEVGKVLEPYEVNGTIINIPLTTTRDVLKQIKKLNIHNMKGTIDFGLSVFVQVYPGQVASVWVFLSTLADKVNV